MQINGLESFFYILWKLNNYLGSKQHFLKSWANRHCKHLFPSLEKCAAITVSHFRWFSSKTFSRPMFRQCRWCMTNSIPLNTMVTLIFMYLVFIHVKRHNSLKNIIKNYHHNGNINIEWTKLFKNYTNNVVWFYLDAKRCIKIKSGTIYTFLSYLNYVQYWKWTICIRMRNNKHWRIKLIIKCIERICVW